MKIRHKRSRKQHARRIYFFQIILHYRLAEFQEIERSYVLRECLLQVKYTFFGIE